MININFGNNRFSNIGSNVSITKAVKSTQNFYSIVSKSNQPDFQLVMKKYTPLRRNYTEGPTYISINFISSNDGSNDSLLGRKMNIITQ